MVKNPPANAEDWELITGLRRSPGEGNGNPLKYSCHPTLPLGKIKRNQKHRDIICQLQKIRDLKFNDPSGIGQSVG